MKSTLEKVSRLYELVEEMRTITAELKQVNVDVRIGNMRDYSDPLTSSAAIMITLNPGCEKLEGSR